MNTQDPIFPIELDPGYTVKQDDKGNAIAIGTFGGRFATAWVGPAGKGYQIFAPPAPLPIRKTLWQKIVGWFK